MRKFRKPYRIKRKKLIFRNRFFWLTLLTLIIIGGLFYFIVFSPIFQIKEIKISGNQIVSAENLENFVKEKISQRVSFFSSDNIFLINLDRINESILEKFPQITKVNLKRKFPDTLIAQIEEKKSVAIFCQADSCFLVDEKGVIFEKFIEGEKMVDIESRPLVIRNLTSQNNLKLGEKAVEKEKLSQILEIESKLKGDLKISEVSIISEERFNVKTTEGWEIYFNTRDDINWQLTKLNLVLKERIPEDKRRNVEYIDLRFEKVYIFPENYNQ